MGGLTKALPLVGAVAGGAIGSAVPGVGTVAGAGLGMGLGSASQGLLSKPLEQPTQGPAPIGGDGTMSRRLNELKSSSDNALQQLRQAALALPQLPPEVRTEAAHPIFTALISDAYGRPMKG